MTTPIRLHLSRAKGFDLQLLSRTTNGLPAKSVARPGAFGNPFTHADRSVATRAYRAWLIGTLGVHIVWDCKCRWGTRAMTAIRQDVRRHLPDLRGHNLACWCPLPEPGQPDHCHAAVLLEVANADPR